MEVKTTSSDAHTALVELLVEERQHAGLRQADLAERLGEYQSWIARLESGQRRVDVVEFFRLAKVIGFDPYKALHKLGF